MNSTIQPALTYTPCTELWCITAYFNPAHYRTRRANYQTFAAPIRAAGIPLLTVEYACGNAPFELPTAPDVLQVRGPHVLWQKERLLNLGVARLPPQATKVAWLDGDILFAEPDWAVRTAALLDAYPVAQPFTHAIRLEQGERTPGPHAQRHESFAAAWQRDRRLIRAGGLDVHGHTGFAWAARRDLLVRHGLYEAALNANGDHLMAHAMACDLDGPCVSGVTSFGRAEFAAERVRSQRLTALLLRCLPARLKRAVHHAFTSPHRPYRQHFFAWAKPVAEDVRGAIGCVPGSVLHIWHGEGVGDRGHGSGRLALLSRGFDPATDLRIGASGCLEWATDKPELHAWAQAFFAARREDGV
jgi:hypothetical protein